MVLWKLNFFGSLRKYENFSTDEYFLRRKIHLFAQVQVLLMIVLEMVDYIGYFKSVMHFNLQMDVDISKRASKVKRIEYTKIKGFRRRY